jgi:signal transduction histidine kinase
MEACAPWIEQRHHRLLAAIPEHPVYVRLDVGRMIQAVSNLLTNAANYMPEGGRIELSVAERGGMVAVSVRDAGVGIAPENLERIFQRFVQVESAGRGAEGSGLGVGLAIVKAIVETHGGAIEARSEGVGRGSEFTVLLPVAAAESIQLLSASGPQEVDP